MAVAATTAFAGVAVAVTVTGNGRSHDENYHRGGRGRNSTHQKEEDQRLSPSSLVMGRQRRHFPWTLQVLVMSAL